MQLRLNTLFEQAGIEPNQVRLLRHQDQRAARGRSPFELWRDDRGAFEFYQSGQAPTNRSKLSGRYWASFIVPPSGETILAGFYACELLGVNQEPRPWPHAEGEDPAGACDVYRLTPAPEIDHFKGRLVIEWGSATRTWIQRADNQNKEIVELRRVFREDPFPGFLRFSANLSRLESLPRGWLDTLAANKGIYILTCPRTREQYIGSATGADGFMGRWRQYARDGHGGNVGLKSREISDYEVAILEVAGSNATSDDILHMETIWKNKLRSREMGLNRN